MSRDTMTARVTRSSYRGPNRKPIDRVLSGVGASIHATSDQPRVCDPELGIGQFFPTRPVQTRSDSVDMQMVISNHKIATNIINRDAFVTTVCTTWYGTIGELTTEKLRQQKRHP